MSVYPKKRKDGTTAWYYYFCYKGKRYRAVGGATRTQALRAADKARMQVLNDHYGLEHEIAEVSLERFSETFLERRQHLKSIRRDGTSIRNVLRFFVNRMLGSIDPSDIEDYIVHRKGQGVANGTINRELTCLKRMYTLAIRWKQAKRNPVLDVDFLKEPPGRTRFLSAEEARLLLKCCSAALYPIVFTALSTGMRLQEILTLQWKLVHIDTVVNPFIELNQTKNNKKRAIPLSDEMVALLQELCGRHAEFVFVGERGRPLQSVRKPFETALKRSGILDFRFHDLRHTFASHFVMQGGDLLALKDILGHSSLEMVQRYAHLAHAHKRQQVNQIKGLFSVRHLNATCGNVVGLVGNLGDVR